MARLNRITALSTVDQLIVGILVLFLFVFLFELSLVVPCGGWDQLDQCDSSRAPAARAAWQGYYEIDPYWADMSAQALPARCIRTMNSRGPSTHGPLTWSSATFMKRVTSGWTNCVANTRL